ncbi:MAG: hypothetical protein E6J80_00435 [Deltaproteobacteria bacterium]|nr:MAG: hypothetical protein E6J80_00435 [Deltaproteobacteria bacterium]
MPGIDAAKSRDIFGFASCASGLTAWRYLRARERRSARGECPPLLTELGDTATAVLVRQAIDRFSAWKFEAGEELLERALEQRLKKEHQPPRSPYFNTCALAVG